MSKMVRSLPGIGANTGRGIARVRRLIIVAAAILCAIAGAPAFAADWPTDGRDNQRRGVTPESLAPPLALQWIFKSPFPPAKGWARPVNGYGATKDASNVSFDDAFRVAAAGGLAYFASSAENTVYAVDAAKGAVAWTFVTDAPPRAAPAVWNGKVYFGADDGKAYCLRAADGTPVWTFDCAPTREKMLGAGRFISLWPLRTGVTVERGRAYFTAGLFPSEGVYFFCVDAETGKLVWRRQLDKGGVDGPSPQGRLLASSDSIYMTSRVAPTRWSFEDGRPLPFLTPLPQHEYRFYNGGSDAQLWGENIVYGQAAILAYDPNKEFDDKYGRKQKGELLFHWFNARQARFKDGLAYIATDYHLLAVKQERLAELAAAECKEFEAAYKRHRVASYLTALDELAEHGADSPAGRQLQNTSLKWGRQKFDEWPATAEKLFAKFARKCEWMTPLKANAALIAAGDVLYAGGEDFVAALDAKTGRELWRDGAAGRVRGLAVANQRLFVSATDQSVKCYAPGAKGKTPKQILGPAGAEPYKQNRFAGEYAGVARYILRESGVEQGYCLILGGAGIIAHEIARRTRLHVYVLQPDATQVKQARRALAQVQFYGGRVTVEQAALDTLPFPPYTFNLVVAENSLYDAVRPTPLEEILRVTKPCGGVAWIGWQPDAREIGQVPNRAQYERDMATLDKFNAKNISLGNPWAKIVRGKIKGATDWTHNYATPANTHCSEDPLVKGPFGILWYGEPGPRKRIDRHAGGPMPLVVDGVMFLTGRDLVMAYDVYNGVQYWERTIVGATRMGLPLGTSNLAADETSLYLVVDNANCQRLDAKTGRTLKTYPAPAKPGAAPDHWAWIARGGGLLYGSRPEIDAAKRRPNPQTSAAVFALDVETGDLRWTYEGQGIDHDGIAIGGGAVFLADRKLTDDERRQALAATVRDAAVADRQAVDAKGAAIPPDLRQLVALDAQTGAVRWRRPFNATDITLDDVIVSAGRVGVACMVKDGVVVVHGTGSLGHPYQEFLGGKFARRALYAYASADGQFLWGGRKGYRKRPIVVGDYVYAEPHAWRLKTGAPKTYTHPLSGRTEPFDFFRGYIGCSHLLGSGAALFGNMNGIAHLNLDERSGYTPFGNMALACGLNAVPANGVFVAPEGRSGCTCATPIFTSIALYPRHRARAWSLGIPAGVSAPQVTPVKHVAINLGAPGFREDADRTLWIPYPWRGGGGGLLGKWLPAYQHSDEMCYRRGEEGPPIQGTDRPWIFTSGYAHDKPLKFTLLEKGQAPARYTVRLYFAEPDDLPAGQRVFSVALQGATVLKNFDIVREAGRSRKALVKEFKGLEISRDLIVELKPASASKSPLPLLCAIEATAE